LWIPLVLFGAGLLSLFFLTPRAIHLAFLVLLPFSVEVSTGSDLKIDLPTEAVVPLLAAAILIRILLMGGPTLVRSRLHLPILVFAVYPLLTLLNTHFPLVSAKAIVRDGVFILGGYGFAVLLLRDRRDLSRIWKVLLAASALVALYGLVTQLRQGIRMYQDIARPFFQTHSIYAMYLSFYLAAVLGVALCGPRKGRWLLYTYVPFVGLAIVTTFTRGAWLGALGALLFYLWVFRKHVPAGLLVTGIVLLALVPAVIMVADLTTLFVERFERFLDPQYSTNFDRIDRWMSALAIWRDHPILGAGWGTYGDEYFRGYTYNQMSYASRFRMGAHNIHLEQLADGGLIAASLFLWVLWTYFAEARRIYRETQGNVFCRTALLASFGAVLSYLIHGQVNNLGPSDKISVTFWFLLAVPAITERIYWKENTQVPGT
jgi:O-antigen ligase